MKLSPKQKEVIRLMREGWELGEGLTIKGGCWLQKGGCGKGGASQDLSISTVLALFNRGLIKEYRRNFPLITYTLTDLGKTIEI